MFVTFIREYMKKKLKMAVKEINHDPLMIAQQTSVLA